MSSFYWLLEPKASKMFGAKLYPYKSILNFPFALWLLPSIFAINKKTFMAALFLVIDLLITRQRKSSWIFFSKVIYIELDVISHKFYRPTSIS